MIKDKLPVKFDKLKTIYHLADIHIRNVKRHQEYREVFDRLYSELKKDVENAIIVVAGDIGHSKLDMSPELVDLTFDFLESLSGIMPTIVIAGNHDCNLANPHRMDILSPIVKKIQNKNLYYLKHSGIYDVADAKFVVMSVFDEPKNYIKSSQVSGDTKIALYHGTVQNAVSETGFKLQNDKVNKKTFEGYDLVLLGDIHKKQFLDNKKRIAFPGSLLQQNFGEDVEHGLLKWEVFKRKSEFIPIPNDYAYITLNITDGEIPDISNLLPKSRLRLMIRKTLSSRITEILTNIREKYPNLQDVTPIYVPEGSLVQDGINVNKINIGDARDVSFQNAMIKEFLVRQYSVVDENVLNKIYEINNELNKKLTPLEFQRNIIWKAKSFDFSNMFSYGSGNKIDFTKFMGIVGLFAPNRTGKSNFLESLCFTIFDKSPRALKSESAMNNKKNSFNSKFIYEIGNKEFRIKRNGIRKKTGQVVVKTDFSGVNGGERKSLNAERRSSTNMIIKNYLGDYDSFIMTALVPQIDLHKGTNANLINMRQADRKNLLNKFLDLTIFQELYDIARPEISKIDVKLGEFEKRNFSRELAEVNIKIKLLNKKYNEKNEKKKEYETLNKKINKEITNLTKKLVKINIDKTNIEKLENDKKIYQEKIKDYDDKIKKINDNLKELDQEIENISFRLLDIDENILDKFNLVKEIEKQKEDAQHNVDKYQIKIDTKREQLGDFSKLEFDPLCEKCISNKEFVENKMETEDDLLENETTIQVFKKQLNNFNNMLKTSNEVKQKYNLFLSLKEQMSEKENQQSKEKHLKISDERTLDDLRYKLGDTKKDIDLYHKNKKTIENNKEVQSKIDEWEIRSEIVDSGISKITKEIMKIYSEIELNKNKKQKIEDEIEEIKKLEIQSAAYKFYMESVEKDGVPFDLIVKTMPIIEHEVNSILGQMVDFQISFNIDEQGKDIEPKIVYNGEDAWAIELVSGMERFIASVAIRVALLSISSLPRPNFLIIDEGWSSLDSENANNLYRLFDFLKTQFDWILVISHLDWIKDFADQIIELKNENGFSKITGE